MPDLRVAPALLDAGAAFEAGEARVGGKAMGLARLERAGAPVPWWMVLPAEAFRRHLAAAGLEERVREALASLDGDGVEAAGEELRRAVADVPLDPELAAAVRRAVDGRGPIAVRSSVVGEDSATHSFAGLFDSRLFLREPDEVARAIARCWGSAFNPRALAYRLRAGEPLEPPAMGVIVQEAVEGQVSGVLFTSNPASGRPDEALVSAAWGLGEGIVSGLCATDEFAWAHTGRETSAKVADKDVQLVPDPAGGGTTEAAVPEDRRRVRCLAPEQVAEIARRGLALAGELGGPQDVEWTLRDGDLVLLQARPITAGPGAGPLGARRIVWDNSNVQESFNGVTTPLTFSVAVRSYYDIFGQTLRVFRVPERTIAAHEQVLRSMVGLVHGRVYYNINNWYRLLLLLPSFDRNKEDVEQMLGLDDNPVDFIEGVHLSRAEKLRRAPRMLRVGIAIARAFRGLDRSVERFLDDFAVRTAHLDRERIARADLDELLATAERMWTEIVGDWSVPIVNDLYVSTTSGRVRRLVERAVGREGGPEVVTGLLGGAEGIESMEPTRRLMAMAATIRADPALADALAGGEPAESLAALRERSPSLSAEIDDYVERYGDRCIGEMKLETISHRQDPSFLVQVLRNFSARADLDPAALDAAERDRRDALEREVMAPLGARRRRRLRRALAAARAAVRQRENTRFARTRFFGWYRDIYTAVGHRLHEAGLLDLPRDVFYLTTGELTAYHEGTGVTSDLAGLARLRRRQFAEYERERLPNHFETIGSVHHGQRIVPRAEPEPEPAADGRVLRGIGCCPGVVEGELRVIMSPDDDLAVNGKVLTTLRTDPGWTPLFPSAAALLVERGSTLSHSAVVAREFGIPTVVGVPDLLRIVRDGERVRLDGGAGTVERLDAP